MRTLWTTSASSQLIVVITTTVLSHNCQDWLYELLLEYGTNRVNHCLSCEVKDSSDSVGWHSTRHFTRLCCEWLLNPRVWRRELYKEMFCKNHKKTQAFPFSVDFQYSNSYFWSIAFENSLTIMPLKSHQFT